MKTLIQVLQVFMVILDLKEVSHHYSAKGTGVKHLLSVAETRKPAAGTFLKLLNGVWCVSVAQCGKNLLV